MWQQMHFISEREIRVTVSIQSIILFLTVSPISVVKRIFLSCVRSHFEDYLYGFIYFFFNSLFSRWFAIREKLGSVVGFTLNCIRRILQFNFIITKISEMRKQRLITQECKYTSNGKWDSLLSNFCNFLTFAKIWLPLSKHFQKAYVGSFV